MSQRFKLILFLLSAGAAGFAAGSVWNWRVAVTLFFSLMASVFLASWLFGKGAHAKEPSGTAEGTSIALGRRTQRPEDAHTSALLEAMMNGMREGMLVVNDDLRVVASNRKAREIFSNAERGLESFRLSELSRNPLINSAFTSSLKNNEQAEVKVEMMGPSGPIFDLRVVPLRLDEAGARGAMGVFFDITRLERLERVRQEFLSNVSHELRTPLTAIIAFVETLEDRRIDDPENSRRFLSIIRKNADRMTNLIDDILELSEIEAGMVQVKLEPITLRLLVNDVVTALGSRAASSNVTLTNDVAEDVTVFADARRLEQMLSNLVHNAIKFNRENGSVTIAYQRGARDRISIADTGDGIPPEHVKRIFERFYRVDRARSREMGGTGLGLAIVKHLARAHGGEVRVESTPGEGSTFVIELPVEAAKQLDDSPRTESSERVAHALLH
jgi:two-component system phosphate regulon sensor histidine kinase PhoR